MRKIRITLHKDGTQKVEVIGAQGQDCVALTRDLEGRLGSPSGERELKPEYHEAVPEVERDRELGS